jgi:sphingomyelin phosphodiesterase acid-like 3
MASPRPTPPVPSFAAALTRLGGYGILLLTTLPAFAQPAPPPATIPALFLSDIHLDPYADPAKVARLNAAPAVQWPAILAALPSDTQKQDSAALQTACPVRGIDTDYTLWQSSLKAIHANAARIHFATISGDLLAHSFDCKYKNLLPNSTPAAYVEFTAKTIQYIASTLRQALPAVPVYISMGNNDSGCTDYQLDPTHDRFLTHIAPIVAAALSARTPHSDRTAVEAEFAATGNYTVPLAGVPNTTLIVLDDLYLAPNYAQCGGKPDPAPAAAQIEWLDRQLASARLHRQHVWVMGHIPPGVNLYATARKLTNVCTGGKPQMFLGSEALAEVLARNADIIRLALFGHTHSDEMRLLAPEAPAEGSVASPQQPATAPPGVPLKVVASITPVNGNRPTFTLAAIRPATATFIDYTVIEASNTTGIDTAWAPEYTYSSTYHQPAFDSASLRTLISGFQSDPSAHTDASRAYLRNYFPGDLSAILQLVWPQYACSLSHDSAAAFTACSCATTPTP